jgi:hypothetical protein
VTPYRNYLILFRKRADRVEVYRVVHAARSLAKLIREIETDDASLEE